MHWSPHPQLREVFPVGGGIPLWLVFGSGCSRVAEHVSVGWRRDAVRDKMFKIPELDEATARKIGDFIQKKANATSRFGNLLLSGTDVVLSVKVRALTTVHASSGASGSAATCVPGYRPGYPSPNQHTS
jgi:hypothetical protein